jgi:hypothetical protein
MSIFGAARGDLDIFTDSSWQDEKILLRRMGSAGAVKFPNAND